MKIITLLSYGVGLALSAVAPSQAASLPILDGAYVTKPQFCEDLRRGELDMLDFEVSENGASFSFPEVSCVVAEVKDVRTNRLSVTGDCNEFGEIWQSSFFLDLIDYDEIAINGVPHFLCDLEVPPTDFGPEWAQFVAQPDALLCWFVAARETHTYWWEGDSEDLADLVPTRVVPAGTEIPAYRQGANEVPAIGPDGTPLVAEFRGYFVPLTDLKFVGRCGPSR